MFRWMFFSGALMSFAVTTAIGQVPARPESNIVLLE